MLLTVSILQSAFTFLFLSSVVIISVGGGKSNNRTWHVKEISDYKVFAQGPKVYLKVPLII